MDTGIGIAENDLDKLFSLFGRIKDKKNEILNPTGAGLGLVISNTLVKMLNKDENEMIRVRSKVNSGSIFSFRIRNLLE